MSSPASRRVPPLALATWGAAAAVIAGLAVAVAHYLSGSGGGMHMHMHADDLTRGGTSDAPSSPLLGSSLLTAWHLDAVALALLVVAAAAYLTGVALVPLRSVGARWPLRHTALFLAGLAVCAFATNGSIAVYDQVLFSAHMAGHLALVMVAPALLAGGRPLALLLAASPASRRDRIARALRGRVLGFVFAPPVALATYTLVIVGSHLTGIMDTVMRNTWAGQVEHLVYLLAGYQFFALVIGNEPFRWRLGYPARWLLLALAMAVDTFTGIVLMQQSSPVGMRAAGFAVDALGDTRTGGAIMWFGGDAIMMLIMVGLVVAWLRTVDTAPAERGWLEQARSATFEKHTGATESESIDSDSDDAAREAYNSWLAKLDR